MSSYASLLTQKNSTLTDIGTTGIMKNCEITERFRSSSSKRFETNKHTNNCMINIRSILHCLQICDTPHIRLLLAHLGYIHPNQPSRFVPRASANSIPAVSRQNAKAVRRRERSSVFGFGGLLLEVRNGRFAVLFFVVQLLFQIFLLLDLLPLFQEIFIHWVVWPKFFLLPAI